MTAQYEKDGTTGEYGPNYYASTETCNVYPAGGILAVKLDAAHSKTLNAVALQNRGTAGAITIKAAYFANEAEYAEAKAAADKLEKAVDIDATGGTHELKAKDFGWDSKWLGKDVSAFNTLVFEIASVDGHGKIALQGKLADGADANFDQDLPASTEAKTYMVDILKWGELSQYAFQNLNKPDGEQYTKDDIEVTTIVVTKVYLTNKTVEELSTGTNISNTVVASKVNANAPVYNLAGQKVSKSYKGVVIQNGKKFVQK